MHQIRFRPGLCGCPGPRWGSSRRSPRPPSRLGTGHPSPFPPPSAPRFSRLRRSSRRLASSVPPLLFSQFKHWTGPITIHCAANLSAQCHIFKHQCRTIRLALSVKRFSFEFLIPARRIGMLQKNTI